MTLILLSYLYAALSITPRSPSTTDTKTWCEKNLE
jgi:hypothetical protein